MEKFNGLGMNLGNLSRLSHAQSRSICGENPTGGKGAGAMAEPDPHKHARELGRGWKCSACRNVEPGETLELANIDGPGAIQSMWFAAAVTREMILRIYWDGQEHPSVEVPICDFFGAPWVKFSERGTKGPLVLLNSLPVVINPNRGMNCFWEMPFRKNCRITVQNLNQEEGKPCFHQINYTLTEVPEDCAYFHAQFRRSNPLPAKEVHTLLDGVSGPGHYVGTYLVWGTHSNGWWGEGEVKFYMDGDKEFPTICGTGTEDYFGGAYNFENPRTHRYQPFCTPYSGMPQVIEPDGLYRSQQRFGLYRWHIADPIRFESRLRVTIQAIGWGWGARDRLLPLRDDISSTVFWYQALPTAPFPALPTPDELEII